MHRREEKFIQYYGWKTRKDETTLKAGVDRTIILEWILEK